MMICVRFKLDNSFILIARLNPCLFKRKEIKCDIKYKIGGMMVLFVKWPMYLVLSWLKMLVVVSVLIAVIYINCHNLITLLLATIICLKVILYHLHLKMLETLPNNFAAKTMFLLVILSVYLPLVERFGRHSNLTILND